MSTLKEKVQQLQLEGAMALRLADWYRKQIELRGVAAVEEFYTKRLGLNHIERKGGVEFDGLQLRRQPRSTEQLAVKGIATAQNDAQAQVSSLLLDLRLTLISDGLTAIATLSPAKFHTLTLQVSASFRTRLKGRLKLVYREGRKLVARELGQKAAGDDEGEFDELDTLIDVTDTRVANDVQARIIAAAARGTLAGRSDAALLEFVRSEMTTGSTAYVERIATGAANQTLSIGRSDEMAANADSIDRYEYSALLDQNVCGPCSADDGQTASDEASLTPAPNPDCEGGDYCRCFIVAITA